MLVGFPPGGATDVVARNIADKLNDTLGQTLIISTTGPAPADDRRAGAQGLAAHGSTVMLTIDHYPGDHPVDAQAAGYDPLKDFTPLAGVANYFNALAVSSSLNVTHVEEFGAWVKANPSWPTTACPHVGRVPQFAGQIIGKSFGVTCRCRTRAARRTEGPAGRANTGRDRLAHRADRPPPGGQCGCSPSWGPSAARPRRRSRPSRSLAFKRHRQESLARLLRAEGHAAGIRQAVQQGGANVLPCPTCASAWPRSATRSPRPRPPKSRSGWSRRPSTGDR